MFLLEWANVEEQINELAHVARQWMKLILLSSFLIAGCVEDIDSVDYYRWGMDGRLFRALAFVNSIFGSSFDLPLPEKEKEPFASLTASDNND